MTKVDRPYRLKSVGKFWTLMNKDTGGETIASIILPSFCEKKYAESRCLIDPATGELRSTGKMPIWIKPSTLLEIQDPEYRKRAQANKDTLYSMSIVAGVQFTFQKYLEEWCHDVRADLLRIFFGGDLFCRNPYHMFNAIMEIAVRYPEKLIYTSTRDIQNAEDLVEYCGGIDELPENVVLHIENPDTMFLKAGRPSSTIPVKTYASQSGVDELTYFPDGLDDVVIKLPEQCIVQN